MLILRWAVFNIYIYIYIYIYIKTQKKFGFIFIVHVENFIYMSVSLQHLSPGVPSLACGANFSLLGLSGITNDLPFSLVIANELLDERASNSFTFPNFESFKKYLTC